MTYHKVSQLKFTDLFYWHTSIKGVVCFVLIASGGYLIEKSTAKVEIVKCEFKGAYVRKTKVSRRSSYQRGECYNKELGTIQAKLQGVGGMPKVGTILELTIHKTALSTRYTIDIGRRPPQE